MKTLVPFLSFQTQAQAAMTFYESIFPNTEIVSKTFYPGQEELLLNGHLKLNGSDIYFLDMGEEHAAPIEWGISLYIEMDSEEEFYQVFNSLAEEGSIMMGPEPVGMFKLCTWVTDKFGVTWQLTCR